MRRDDEHDARDDAREELAPTLLGGRNPIREALKSGRDIDRLLVAQGELVGTALQIVAEARARGIVVQHVDRRKLDAMMPGHQGLIAQVPAEAYATVDSLLQRARDAGEAPLIVLLDGITDPHNLGAILRSAEAFGAHGVITGKRRAVGLTPIAVKAAAGAASHIGLARVTNIAQTVEELKKEGLWTVAADARGEDVGKQKLDGPLCVVIGDEGEGVSRLVRERCDQTLAIRLRGKVASLNASVAAGILLFHASQTRIFP